MRALKRTIALTALLLTPALSAFAQEPPPAAPPAEPPPATMPPPAAAPAATPMAAPGLGAAGQIAIQVDLPFNNESPQFAIVHSSTSMGGSSSTIVAIAPSLDYFVAPNVSVGGLLGYAHGSTSASTGTTNAFIIELRAGYNVPLSDMFSIWPHIGLAYQHQSFSSGGMDTSSYSIPLIVTVPVLWHPAQHFFLGLAPTLTTELINKASSGSVSADGPKTTDIGLTAVIGGYFGGT